MSSIHQQIRHAARGLSLIAAGVGLLVLPSCQSGPSAASLGRTTSTTGSVELSTSGKRFSLVSESLLEHIGIPGETAEERTMNFYSGQREDAVAKIAPDDAIAGLVQFYDQNGFAEWSSPGAPTPGADSHLSVTVDGKTRTMVQPSGHQADPEQLTKYIEFVQGTLDVYNLIEGRQNVKGLTKFEDPELSERLQTETSGIGLDGSQR